MLEWRAHIAALAGSLAAHRHLGLRLRHAGLERPGARPPTAPPTELLPIGWIVVNAVFLYNLTVATGQFDIVKASVARLSPDRRIQALLIAFSFGAFIEGACGFGTPVAICSALLMGLGFTPLYAAVLSLIANTAPVAFGAIGTPILTLAAVTGLPVMELSQMAGRQLPFVSVLIPAWLVATMSGRQRPHRRLAGGARQRRHLRHRAVRRGATTSAPSWSTSSAAWRRSSASPCSAASGSRARVFEFSAGGAVGQDVPAPVTGGVAGGRRERAAAWRRRRRHLDRAALTRAWMPWVILSVVVIIWGLAPTKALFNGGPAGLAAVSARRSRWRSSMALAPTWDVPMLHRMVFRDFPVEPVAVDAARINDPQYRNTRAEAARFTVNYVSATGSGILVAAILTAHLPRRAVRRRC